MADRIMKSGKNSRDSKAGRSFRKNFLGSPAVTAVLFLLAAVMLLGSTIGGARAALTYYSESYVSRVQMSNIGVTLLENGERVSWRDYGGESDGQWSQGNQDLLENLLQEGESFQLGRAYEESLSVANSGNIDQYVRVSIYRYWLDADGKKMTGLSPALIDLNLIHLGEDWIIDEKASTEERIVLYYTKILESGGQTPAFSDTLTVDPSVASKVSQRSVKENGYTTIVTTYDYDGVQFRIKAEVDAVQTHNAEDAIRSAWGRSVTVGSDGTLSLN